MKGHVKERPQLRNALKDKLIPVNSTAPAWGVVQSVMDVPLKKFDQIVIGHQIGLPSVPILIVTVSFDAMFVGSVPATSYFAIFARKYNVPSL